jgi:D-tyrosyl-tRNA(Tyr) deacylase
LLILLGVASDDDPADIEWLSEKIATLRIFEDDAGKMNKSLVDVGSGALVVSQFTLFADCSRGRRPFFGAAAPPEIAAPMVDAFARALAAYAPHVVTGSFGAKMAVELVNNGPVTISLDSRAR